MENYILNQTFERCFGLRDSLKKSIESKNRVFIDQAIATLATQSGLRKQWILDNLETILK